MDRLVPFTCAVCGVDAFYRHGGRPAKYCSSRCARKAAKDTAKALAEAEQLGSWFAS
jgi:hypothetical protein